MKISKLLKYVLTFALVVSGASLMAQNTNFGPEWGESATPEERQQNVLLFNYYKDAYSNKDYDLALTYLPQLLEKCPKCMNSLYVYAINIYKNKIGKSKTVSERGLYTDSLMMLYDTRLVNFADDAKYGKGYILKAKAKDYFNFKAADKEGMIAVFKDAVDANLDDVDPVFINQYFSVLTDEYLEMNVDTDTYMGEYEKLGGLIADAASADEQSTFDQLFIKSGAANCENLEKIYKPRLEANPDDADLLAKAFTQMSKGDNCRSDFYFQIGEKYVAANPTSSSAMLLAKAYEDAGNYAKSLDYLKAAVENESDPTVKAQLCVQISGNELGMKNARSAADFARQAISINPENGYAYIFLAQAYAMGSSNCSDFDAQSVYWLAYDTLMNARRLFEGDASQLGIIDSQAASYRAMFPNKEECFFRGLSAGSAYDVRCGWVSGRTVVKEGR